jgi:hypothetical protein
VRPAAIWLVAAIVVGACSFGPRSTPPEHLIVPAAPMPQPPPAVKVPTAAIEAFVKNATSATWSYRVNFKGRAAGAADLGVVQGHMDVSGVSCAQTMTFDFSRDYPGLPKIPVSVRGIKDKAWMKQFDDGWKAVKGYDVSQTSTPFMPIKSARDIKFIDTEEFEGKTVHRISFSKGLLLHPRTIPGMLAKEKIRLSKTEILIDDKGRPIRGKFYLEALGRVGESGGQLQEIVFDVTISFSKLGQKVTIKRP